jgi:hypothetical protein
LPSSLALTTIASDAEILSSDHRNNYAAIQAAVNALIAALSGGSSGQVLTAADAADVQWAAGRTTYRKTVAKAVNSTTSATDLLNGEITIAAGVMGTTGLVRLTAGGDWVQNTGAGAAPPRFQVIFGGTTLFDTGTPGATTIQNAGRAGWRLTVDILNTATAAQAAIFNLVIGSVGGFTTGIVSFTTGEGVYGTNGSRSDIVAPAATTATVNTANACSLVLNVINGSSSANYETKLLSAVVEVV